MASAADIVRWTPWPGIDAKPEVMPRARVPVLVRLRSGLVVGPAQPEDLGWAHAGSGADITGFGYPETNW
jgi:hypothetical protein